VSLSETDLAYFAGFFDGEGCVTIGRGVTQYKGRIGHWVLVQVTNTDPRPIQALHDAFAGHMFRDDRRRGNERPCYRWQANSRVACRFLEAIRPYSRIKAEQIDVALAFQETLRWRRRTTETIAERDTFAAKLKLLKHVS
jgi:hypothetical protein